MSDTPTQDEYMLLAQERSALRVALNAATEDLTRQTKRTLDAEAERDALRQAINSIWTFTGHDHWDREGTHGANCPLCVAHREWAETHKAAIDAARKEKP